jgi:hypothetical protein
MNIVLGIKPMRILFIGYRTAVCDINAAIAHNETVMANNNKKYFDRAGDVYVKNNCTRID